MLPAGAGLSNACYCQKFIATWKFRCLINRLLKQLILLMPSEGLHNF